MNDGTRPIRSTEMPTIRRQLVDSCAIDGIMGVLWQAVEANPDIYGGQFAHFPSPRLLALSAERSDLWWLTEDAVDLVAQAAPSIPDDACLTPDLVAKLPAGTGIIIGYSTGIESGTWMEEEEDRAVPLRVLLAFPWRAPDESPVVGLVWFAPTSEQIGSAERFPGQWAIVVSSTWTQGAPINAPHHDGAEPSESDIEDRRLFLSTAALVAQDRVLTSDIQNPSRPVRRAAERAGKRADIDAVRVCDLRSSSRDSRTESEGEGGRYRHRWIVAGHWRSQPYGPQSKLRKPVFIAPHIKGPEGAPVLSGEKVYAVRGDS